MRRDAGQIEGASALAPAGNGAGVLAATAVGAGEAQASVSLPGLPSLRLPALHVPQALRQPRAGRIALASIVVCLLSLTSLPAGHVVEGVAAAFGLANLAGAVIAWRILSRRLRGLGGPTVLTPR